MKFLNRLIFAILILLIPVVCILAAANVSFRIADVYRFELNRSGVMKEINLDETTDNLARFFSNYMLGKLDNFQYTANYMGRERPVFGVGEGAAMSRFRNLLNMSLAALAASALLAFLAFCVLLWQKKKEAVRVAYNAGTALYALASAALLAAIVLDGPREELFGRLSVYRFEESDLLPQLLPASSFLVENYVVVVVISFILLSLGRSAVKRLTLPDRMFY
ncbi:MAG: hypothetical protein LBG71_05415 [Clostridiales Family XIII bacterium]|jgi:hypothetical protein|nr:hypothetical protein [Clostridiales Family XIII bacterium]